MSMVPHSQEERRAVSGREMRAAAIYDCSWQSGTTVAFGNPAPRSESDFTTETIAACTPGGPKGGRFNCVDFTDARRFRREPNPGCPIGRKRR
jgi:hypothetical protein